MTVPPVTDVVPVTSPPLLLVNLPASLRMEAIVPAFETVPEFLMAPACAFVLLMKAAAAATSASVMMKLLVTVPPVILVCPVILPSVLLVKLPAVLVREAMVPALDALPALVTAPAVALLELVKMPADPTTTSWSAPLFVTTPPATVVLPVTSPSLLLVKEPPSFRIDAMVPAFDAVPAFLTFSAMPSELLMKMAAAATSASVITKLLVTVPPVTLDCPVIVPSLVNVPAVLFNASSVPALLAVPALVRVPPDAPLLLVKVPPEDTVTSPTVPLLVSAVVSLTAALPSVPFTETLPLLSVSFPLRVPSMNRLPSLSSTFEFITPSALIPRLPDWMVVPFLTVRLPVSLIVTSPPSISSFPTVASLITCGEPVLTSAVSFSPGAEGFQFVPVLNSLFVLPDQTDWAREGVTRVTDARAVNKPIRRE